MCNRRWNPISSIQCGTIFNILTVLYHYFTVLMCYNTIVENCRKLTIVENMIFYYFNFPLTENMIFSSFAKTVENIILFFIFILRKYDISVIWGK